jgi:putative transposase
VLRTDNAIVYASIFSREVAKSYGLHQEFILPHTPEQNGVAESVMDTVKLECVWQHRFETYDEAKAAITTWARITTSRDRTRGSTTSCRRNGAAGKPN